MVVVRPLRVVLALACSSNARTSSDGVPRHIQPGKAVQLDAMMWLVNLNETIPNDPPLREGLPHFDWVAVLGRESSSGVVGRSACGDKDITLGALGATAIKGVVGDTCSNKSVSPCVLYTRIVW